MKAFTVLLILLASINFAFADACTSDCKEMHTECKDMVKELSSQTKETVGAGNLSKSDEKEMKSAIKQAVKQQLALCQAQKDQCSQMCSMMDSMGGFEF